MSDTIEIQVRYSENDFVRGMKFSNARNKSGKAGLVLFTVSALAAYVAVYFFTRGDEGFLTSSDAVTFSVGALIAASLAYVLKDFVLSNDVAFSRMYNASPLFRELYTIRFAGTGIDSASESLSSEVKWEAIVDTAETDDDFYFFLGPHHPLFIPKRVFSAQQQLDLRLLAEDRLGPRYNFLPSART